MADNISTRQQQILKLLLDNKQGLSIDEISIALGISRNAVTQHFSGLEDKGYLRFCAKNKTAGRPVCIYTLTDAGINYFPKQYAWLSELILTDLKQSLGSKAFEDYLHNLAEKLSLSLLPQFANKDIAERVRLLLEIMEKLGFQATLSPSSESQTAIIQASNCIYHDLAQKHEEVCAFDKTLISVLIATPVEQISCMAKGEHICAFKMNPE